MGFYFENTAITGGVPEVLAYINEQFISGGWDSLPLNLSSSEPSTSEFMRSYAWKSNGRTGSVGDLPAHHWLFMGWGKDSQTNSHIYYGCASAAKVFGTGSISKTSDTVLISSSVPNNVREGDVIWMVGGGTQDLNKGWESDDDPFQVTNVINANQFNYEDTSGPVNVPEVGYTYGLALYNPKGTFSCQENNVPFGMGQLEVFTGIDNPLNWNLYGYVDEYRMALILETGGNFGMYYGGLTGRGHVPNSWKHVGALSASITGTGGPMLLGLDRACPSMSVGQPIWLVPPDEASGSKSGSFGSPSRIYNSEVIATCSAKPEDHIVEVFIANGAEYTSGTLVGYDPCPCVIIGNDGIPTTWAGTLNATCVSYPDGTNYVNYPTLGIERPEDYDPNVERDSEWSTSWNPKLLGTGSTGEQFRLYHGADISLRSDNGDMGHRYPLVGFVAWSQADQNNGDLMVVGENIAANRWKIFPSITADSTPANMKVSVGPGAS